MSLSPFSGEIVKTISASGSAVELSLSHGTIFDLTLTVASVAITLPAAAPGHSFHVVVRQDATGGRVASWVGSVGWPNSGSPTLSLAPSTSDTFRFVCIDGVNWIANRVGIAPSAAWQLWNSGDTICRPDSLATFGGSPAPASGQIYWMGGPGMVVPAGQTVRGVEWSNNGASVTPTHQWFAVGIPDETGLNQVTVVATSKDDLTTPWAANTPKKLSLLAGDGGSGAWTPTVDTPVYAGVLQVAATPATIRGTAASAANDRGTPLHWGSGPAALSVPSDLAGISSIAATSILCGVCRLSNTST